jgi:hypothetical protein
VAYDCQKCGACCATFDVPLDAEDEPRMRAAGLLDALTFPYERPAWSVRFLKRDATSGRCLALVGPLGACACTIYPCRPNLCRALEPGSEHCHEARRKHGFPVDEPPPPQSAPG